MKVLMINGSPNEKGCTYTALSEVAKTLEECGVESEIFHIGKAPVPGCQACFRCTKSQRCVIGDGVNEALDRMERCDGLILGAPVHYASPAGGALAFLDRMFYAGGRQLAHKPGAAVISARRAGTTAALDVLNKYFTISQMPVVSSTYWNMVHGNTPADVLQDQEGLHTMRTLARNMAWLLRCIEAGKAQGDVPPETEHKVWTNFIR